MAYEFTRRLRAAAEEALKACPPVVVDNGRLHCSGCGGITLGLGEYTWDHWRDFKVVGQKIEIDCSSDRCYEDTIPDDTMVVYCNDCNREMRIPDGFTEEWV